MNAEVDRLLSRVRWVDLHIRSLDRVIAAFHTGRPHKVSIREQDGQRIYVLAETATAPPELALMTGDIVHNLRSTLDNLLWRLMVVKHTTVPKEWEKAFYFQSPSHPLRSLRR